MEITKEQREKAAKLAFEILSLNKVEADAKKRKNERKEELAELCKSVHGIAFINNEWELPEADAVIKVALNPHKVFDSITGKPLDPKRREEIAITLADKYCTVDLDVIAIQKHLELDKGLKSSLVAANAKIAQETSYQVKHLK
jgi:hypothetical protein